MSKDKRQLRAEAVEQLKSLKPRYFSREEIIDLLTDDEEPMFADGCRDPEVTGGWPDEPPEGDAVAILRKAARCTSVNTSVGDVLRYNVPGNEPSAWQTEEDACEALADMVECDYVRREEYVTMGKTLGLVQAERDEWKARAEKLAERMDKREDTMRRLAKLVDVTPEAEYSYNGDPQSVVDGGDFGELATLVFGAVRRLMSERGEWKAKAEQAERAMNAAAGKWAKADAELRTNADMSEKETGSVREGGEMSAPEATGCRESGEPEPGAPECQTETESPSDGDLLGNLVADEIDASKLETVPIDKRGWDEADNCALEADGITAECVDEIRDLLGVGE